MKSVQSFQINRRLLKTIMIVVIKDPRPKVIFSKTDPFKMENRNSTGRTTERNGYLLIKKCWTITIINGSKEILILIRAKLNLKELL
jgi:hypothetical protein